MHGIEPRALADTCRDTIRWLRDSGRPTARQAGREAGDDVLGGAG